MQNTKVRKIRWFLSQSEQIYIDVTLFMALTDKM